MKTSELIKQVEAMGFVGSVEGHPLDNNALRILGPRSETMATVKMNKRYAISTHFGYFKGLTDDEKYQFMAIAWQYISTPVDKREPEKKYKFKLPGIVEPWNYLRYDKSYDEFRIGEVILNGRCKTVFPQSEIDNFPDDIKRLITVAERIEVEG